MLSPYAPLKNHIDLYHLNAYAKDLSKSVSVTPQRHCGFIVPKICVGSQSMHKYGSSVLATQTRLQSLYGRMTRQNKSAMTNMSGGSYRPRVNPLALISQIMASYSKTVRSHIMTTQARTPRTTQKNTPKAALPKPLTVIETPLYTPKTQQANVMTALPMDAPKATIEAAQDVEQAQETTAQIVSYPQKTVQDVVKPKIHTYFAADLQEAHGLAFEAMADTRAMLDAAIKEIKSLKELLGTQYGVPSRNLEGLQRILCMTNVMVNDSAELNYKLEQQYKAERMA